MSTNPGHAVTLAPFEQPDQIVVGQRIGKYRIIRPVGVGGMAQVFLASREGPEGFAKRYVIKRILPHLAHDQQFARMFVTEAKVAAVLDHPNIVHVFDFEIEHGNFYLVMEYVSGASLGNVLRANRRKGIPLGPLLAVEIGDAMAHALAYAHDVSLPDGKPLELVHRDISPGNILLSRDGAVKLADFGVVKTSLSQTEVGLVNGKWAYMSPEQITGEAVDRRSDIFSLGIVLYEIITGRRLFRAENAAATASRVMELEVPHPNRVVADLDPRLDYVVMKMLERDLKTRYQSANALAADLDTLRASPQFSSGTLRLRTLVRSLFPDENQAPVLGASFDEAPGAMGQPDRSSAALDLPSFARPSPPATNAAHEVPVWLVIGLVAACVVGSVIFWLLAL